MKFPGRRKSKHYFPITSKERDSLGSEPLNLSSIFVCGLDQLLVDIEIDVTDEFLSLHQFEKGQSFIIEDRLADEIYHDSKKSGLIRGEFPGGAVGNSLHNYSVLSDSSCVALGAINKKISVGDYAYNYLNKTSSLVDLSYLQPSDKPMGRALCFITPDLERTFAISKGCMNDFSAEFVPSEIVGRSSGLLISAYTLRNTKSPVYEATLKACAIAKENGVPVVMGLGTSSLVSEKQDELIEFIKEYVTVAAMNHSEAIALTGIDDPLLACEKVLDYADMCLITVGEKGLYLGGHSDESQLRMTKDILHSKSLQEYNKYEYSRAMLKKNCEKPVRIYTHINPFLGGPKIIKNTNGAGDAALSALLHDISSNDHHQKNIPNSPKHNFDFLTYSSLSQISKYANRVSFEVLSQSSPRLIKGLPEKEETKDEAYWRK